MEGVIGVNWYLKPFAWMISHKLSVSSYKKWRLQDEALGCFNISGAGKGN